MNVATKQQPAVVPLSPEKVAPKDSKLAAWSSVRQERWQGELSVQGEIPLWLVCMLFECAWWVGWVLKYIHTLYAHTLLIQFVYKL